MALARNTSSPRTRSGAHCSADSPARRCAAGWMPGPARHDGNATPLHPLRHSREGGNPDVLAARLHHATPFDTSSPRTRSGVHCSADSRLDGARLGGCRDQPGMTGMRRASTHSVIPAKAGIQMRWRRGSIMPPRPIPRHPGGLVPGSTVPPIRRLDGARLGGCRDQPGMTGMRRPLHPLRHSREGGNPDALAARFHHATPFDTSSPRTCSGVHCSADGPA